MVGFAFVLSVENYLLRNFRGGWLLVGGGGEGLEAGLIVLWFSLLFFCLLPVDPGFPVKSSGQS